MIDDKMIREKVIELADGTNITELIVKVGEALDYKNVDDYYHIKRIVWQMIDSGPIILSSDRSIYRKEKE